MKYDDAKLWDMCMQQNIVADIRSIGYEVNICKETISNIHFCSELERTLWNLVEQSTVVTNEVLNG